MNDEFNWRSDGRLEWTCNHGIGHTVAVPKIHLKEDAWWVHGCDGCCNRLDKAKHTNDEFETPPPLFRQLVKLYHLSPILDVCATDKNKKCEQFMTMIDNALTKEWKFNAWCNPPYSETGVWVYYAFEQWKKHNIEISMLIPNNSDTDYYWDCIKDIAEIHPIYKRVRFWRNNAPAIDTARDPSILVVWRKR